MPAYRALTLVIRQYDYAETSRILVLFTQPFGKIRAMAKGVKKIHSRLASSTSLLSLSELQLHGKEHQDLYLVTQGQLLRAFSHIKADLPILAQAYRVCELLDKLTPDHEPHPELFTLARETLELLDAGTSVPMAGAWFDLACLDLLGYGPQLSACAQCGQDAEHMVYAPDRGSLVCKACGGFGPLGLSRGARMLLKKIRNLPAEKLKHLRLAGGMEAEITACLDAAFQYQLGRPLTTRKFQKSILPVRS